MELKHIWMALTIGICFCLFILVIGISSNFYGQNKVEQQRDCISAGMEFVYNEDAADFECRMKEVKSNG